MGSDNLFIPILMVTGKGGVAKTSLAAATGIKLASLNSRTLVTSIDSAAQLGRLIRFAISPLSPSNR